MRKFLPVIALAVVLVAAVPIYFRVGWNRMESVCGFGESPLEQRQGGDVPFDREGSRSVAYSWQWSGGFTCTYSNGTVRSAYWF